MITERGQKWWAENLANDGNGYTGTAVSFTSTSLKAEGWNPEEHVGQDVYVGAAVGTILSNTTTVLNVARWEKPAKRNEVQTTPSGTPPFSIASSQAPAAWMGVTPNTAEPKESDTVLTEEPTNASSGFIRKLATFTYLSALEYQLKATFTATKWDSEHILPLTLAKIGIFNAQKEGIMVFETLLNLTAEIVHEGNSVTITETVNWKAR